MAKYKIIYDKSKCIGAGECEAMSPNLWKMHNNGKAELIGAKQNPQGIYEIEIGEAEYKKQASVANSCPSGCIRTIKA